MTASEIDQMSCEDLHDAVVRLIAFYSLRVNADWTYISHLVSVYHMQQMQLEEALEALKRENNE
jgi:hypothetical protein